MLPDRVSNPGPLTYESGALPIALRGPAWSRGNKRIIRLGLSWFNWWVSFAPEFQCCYFCESSYLFYLSFNFDFCVSKIMHL